MLVDVFGADVLASDDHVESGADFFEEVLGERDAPQRSRSTFPSWR